MWSGFCTDRQNSQSAATCSVAGTGGHVFLAISITWEPWTQLRRLPIAPGWLNSVETMCGATYTFKLWSQAWRWKSSPGSWFVMWLYFNYMRAFWANPIAFSNPSVNPQEVKKTAALQLLTPFSKNTGSTECTKKPRKQSGNNYVKWNLLIFSSTLVLVSQVCGKR